MCAFWGPGDRAKKQSMREWYERAGDDEVAQWVVLLATLKIDEQTSNKQATDSYKLSMATLIEKLQTCTYKGDLLERLRAVIGKPFSAADVERLLEEID